MAKRKTTTRKFDVDKAVIAVHLMHLQRDVSKMLVAVHSAIYESADMDSLITDMNHVSKSALLLMDHAATVRIHATESKLKKRRTKQ